MGVGPGKETKKKKSLGSDGDMEQMEISETRIRVSRIGAMNSFSAEPASMCPMSRSAHCFASGSFDVCWEAHRCSSTK